MIISHPPVTAEQDAALRKTKTWLSKIAVETEDRELQQSILDAIHQIGDLIHTIQDHAPAHRAAMEPIHDWARRQAIHLAHLEAEVRS